MSKIKIARLKEEIAILDENIVKAEGEESQALQGVVARLSSQNAREDARMASNRVAYLRSDRLILQNALAKLIEDENSEATKKRKEEACQHFANVEAMAPELIELGEEMDAVLIQFADVMRRWKELHAKMTKEVRDALHKGVRDPEDRVQWGYNVHGGVLNIPLGAIACQIEDALQGTNYRQVFGFCYSRVGYETDYVADLLPRQVENYVFQTQQILGRFA